MKKLFFLVVVASFVAFISGCSSVQIANKFNGLPLDNAVPHSHVNVNIRGLYFLGFLPIVSGSPISSGSCVFFKDTANAQNAVYLLTRTARALGGNKMHNVVTEYDSGVPLLFSMHTVNASCSVSSPEGPANYIAK